jgi:hypothetical protein
MMNVTDKRLQYWNHFIEQCFIEGIGGGHGITGPRLRKVKPIILPNDRFWADIIDRHNGTARTPEEMRQDDQANYDHCLGNFWGMVRQTMVEKGLIKP